MHVQVGVFLVRGRQLPPKAQRGRTGFESFKLEGIPGLHLWPLLDRRGGLRDHSQCHRRPVALFRALVLVQGVQPAAGQREHCCWTDASGGANWLAARQFAQLRITGNRYSRLMHQENGNVDIPLRCLCHPTGWWAWAAAASSKAR